MKIVIITPEVDVHHEVASITSLIEAGIMVHVRKKNKTTEELIDYINQFPIKMRSQMSIHGFHALAEPMKIGGIHLSSNENTVAVDHWPGRVSKSLHNLHELDNDAYNSFNYCFISPVFDSISKKGYKSTFIKGELKAKLTNRKTTFPVFALGGVSTKKFNEIQDLNFDGAAILGNFWKIKDLQSRNIYIQKLHEYVKD